MKGSAALFALLVAAVLAGPKGANACCPEGFTEFEDYCYRHVAESLSWQGAEERCNTFTVSHGGNCVDIGHLASIHSDAEQEFVFEHYRAATQQEGNAMLWLGLSDVASEGDMVWTDGTPLDFVSWRANQPDNWGGVEDCVHMQLESNDPRWNDLPCDSALVNHFMCKLPTE
ncbi:echinoidin-like [Diadema antillarum]|uniref:echinoidin-like n=1 Tax=Diadema antillarum TaxID=105358 RepID=UPI003A85AF61